MQVNCYRALDLHAAAQQARRGGMFELEARLLFDAADEALTPEGRIVLLEKAFDAACRAERRGDIPQRSH